MSKHIVVGCGQVGTAIRRVLGCGGYDLCEGGTFTMSFTQPTMELSTKVNVIPRSDILHICFGYSDTFEESVRYYQELTGAKIKVIHSTVPIGTSAKLNAVHSPVRGKHPDLEDGVRTFTKFFGGLQAEQAAQIFREKGVSCVTTPKSETTEALKLFDTEQYRINILAEKAIYDFCKENGLDYDIVYTKANQTYNEGYSKLGMPQFSKYVLEHMEGEIGGHCVIPNAKLLSLVKLINENQ